MFKYPGGYKIIDLGEIVGDGTDLRPGLYDELINCNKPVVPTYKSGNLIVTPQDAVKMTFCNSMFLTIGGEEKGGCGWVKFTVNLDNASVAALAYIFVEEVTGAIYVNEI